MTNRLASETSPYLRQHADNPVDWFPWGEEARARARAEDRPLLVSIGYSACHWCHVMERESFVDPEVARLMNELFVNVKVDREERPDVDQIYIKAVQAMTGSAGWPLHVWLTPDGVPFYGGTYFPPESRHGMPAFTQVLRATADAFRNRRDQVVEAGSRLVEALSRANAPTPAGPAETSLIHNTAETLASRYDERFGGFGPAPKFPQPTALEALIHQAAREGPNGSAKAMLVHTLSRMADGGIRDQLGGGFHRYSVDARWLVPHFEKMLYDNALLSRLYTDVYRLTGDTMMRGVAEEVLDDVLRDFRAPEGGFYAARDADSEGEEGRFYVWTPEEIDTVLSPKRGARFGRVYGVTPTGNFEGRNILHVATPAEDVAREEGVPLEELISELTDARVRLREARDARPEPLRDEKILTSWNAMAVRALAETGAALGRWDYVAAAAVALDFLRTRLRVDGRLKRVYMEGESRIDAFLEDHAALGNAALSLHGATLDPDALDLARWCSDEILRRFVDEGGVPYDTPNDGEALVLRPRDPSDGATPSGTALAAELFVRAGHVFDEPRYRGAAEVIFEREAGPMSRFGPAFGRLNAALDRARSEPVEIAVVGPRDAAETRALVQAAHARWLPNLTVVGQAPEAPVAGLPLLSDRAMVGGVATAYVCRAYACLLPVTEPAEVARELDRVL